MGRVGAARFQSEVVRIKNDSVWPVPESDSTRSLRLVLLVSDLLKLLGWAVTLKLPAKLRELYRMRIAEKAVEESGLFAGDWYLQTNPDVARSEMRPLAHYLRFGAMEGRDPNPLFDGNWYLEKNPDVAKSGMNPLVHYLKFGAMEGRDPNPMFDTCWYLQQHPEVKVSTQTPLGHYIPSDSAFGFTTQPSPPEKKRPLSQLIPDWNRDWWALLPPPSANPNRLLIVDRKVPTPDLDSGSYRMSKLIDCCVREGIEIDFVGDCEAEQGRYTKELESKGVSRILIGRGAALNHLTKYGMQYQAAILSRPEVAEKYLPLVRAFAVNAKILYDTVDLHWVRLERESRLSGAVDQFETKTKYHKRLELANARAADVTIAITEKEKAQLLAEAPSLTVDVVPNIHQPVDWVPPFDGRRDLLFVGAFGHPPNVDAMHFFLSRVLPSIKSEIPDIRIRIVGSNMPADILRLASPTVKPVGYVHDVEPYFQRARVFVAPLRYGAGMKGKIGQSLSFGLPVVTTGIGAEGIGLVDGENAMVSDDPDGFASRVVRVYRDASLWAALSERGRDLVIRRFSEDAVRQRLLALIG